jgi:hypothetical protein
MALEQVGADRRRQKREIVDGEAVVDERRNVVGVKD